MENIQDLINIATELENKGNLTGALSCYKDAFDMLSYEANNYARQQDIFVKGNGYVKVITSKLFDEKKRYLKSNMMAAIISNNMGALMIKLGNLDEAKKMFKRSIDLTPDDEIYNDPIVKLRRLKK